MPKRVDSNQAFIVAGLREFGASVWVTSNCGKGAPDIVCGYRFRTFPMELKSANGKLTKDEIAWRDGWKGNYYIVHNIEEAIEIITQEE